MAQALCGSRSYIDMYKVAAIGLPQRPMCGQPPQIFRGELVKQPERRSCRFGFVKLRNNAHVGIRVFHGHTTAAYLMTPVAQNVDMQFCLLQGSGEGQACMALESFPGMSD